MVVVEAVDVGAVAIADVGVAAAADADGADVIDVVAAVVGAACCFSGAWFFAVSP